MVFLIEFFFMCCLTLQILWLYWKPYLQILWIDLWLYSILLYLLMFLFFVCCCFHCCRWWCASGDVWMLSHWLLKFISGTKNFALDVWVGFAVTTRSCGGGKVFYIWTGIFFSAIFLYSLWQRWGWIDGCDKAGGGVSVGIWHIDRLLLILIISAAPGTTTTEKK